MKTKLLIGLLAAPLMFGLAMPSYAKKKAEPVTCEDGSTSTAKGRGACSGHGGVKKDAAAPAAAATDTTAAEPAKEKKSKHSKKDAAADAAPAAPAAAPSGGGSTCKDGSTSDKTGRGACSGHGGVAKAASTAAAPAAAAPAAAAPAPAAPPLPARR